ncbi:DUF2510 domain-containing protein [Demequina sp. NBRC 110052]|uniref:DUF2510 domain-containing protein n=1 Tax=Demequina sp. NBRC 110052 TaxID=1570341 RepID=UPI000A03D199|nr:DUF2510 domain-containing protein [Demequina sp. NBRC 110052]
MTWNEGPPSHVRLPDAGWLPDPARSDLERYWSGTAWTSRTRDRVTKIETGVNPGMARGVEPRVGDPRVGRAKPRWKGRLAVYAPLMVLVVVLGYFGRLPSFVPWPDALTRPAPSGPAVAYPVFGSDELVEYLAASMVAQEERIDVAFVNGPDAAEVVNDAMYEALTQNPYVFVVNWNVWVGPTRLEIEPEYVYDDAEAARRRAATAVSVQQLAAAPEVAAAAGDEAALATVVHDLVIDAGQYDYGAYDAINAGESSSTSAVVARSQEAYGLLGEGTAVCTGYAEAYLLLADAVGLEAVIVTGETRSGYTTGGHAWNRVKVDGEWLVIDTTWDDTGSITGRSDYVLLGDTDSKLGSRTVDLDWVVDGSQTLYGF